MCWRAGFIGQAYSSASATPLRVTSHASVWVLARTSPTVVQASSAAGHFSRSMVRGRKSLSSVTYSRTGPMPRGMPPVGKISCIRVSAKAKNSGHFQVSRSMLSSTASDGSTMASSLAEVSSPTCGRVMSSAEASASFSPNCAVAGSGVTGGCWEFTSDDWVGAASAAVSVDVVMPFVLPDSAPMRRFGGVTGRGGNVSSSPAMSPPLSRSDRAYTCARSSRYARNRLPVGGETP